MNQEKNSATSPKYDISGESYGARYPWQRDIAVQCAIAGSPSQRNCDTIDEDMFDNGCNSAAAGSTTHGKRKLVRKDAIPIVERETRHARVSDASLPDQMKLVDMKNRTLPLSTKTKIRKGKEYLYRHPSDTQLLMKPKKPPWRRSKTTYEKSSDDSSDAEDNSKDYDHWVPLKKALLKSLEPDTITLPMFNRQRSPSPLAMDGTSQDLGRLLGIVNDSGESIVDGSLLL